jgi:hypothetical protein
MYLPPHTFARPTSCYLLDYSGFECSKLRKNQTACANFKWKWCRTDIYIVFFSLCHKHTRRHLGNLIFPQLSLSKEGRLTRKEQHKRHKIQVFWDITLCRLVNRKVSEDHIPHTSVTIYQSTRPITPEQHNLLHNRYQNLCISHGRKSTYNVSKRMKISELVQTPNLTSVSPRAIGSSTYILHPPPPLQYTSLRNLFHEQSTVYG